jgi:hypothetical protein
LDKEFKGGSRKGGKIWLRKTMNVNALMGALGMGTVRLVRSTIGKMGLVLIAGKQGMRVARNNLIKKDTEPKPRVLSYRS